jgi:hypothetical protein
LTSSTTMILKERSTTSACGVNTCARIPHDHLELKRL